MDQGKDDASAVDSGGRKRPEQQRYKPGAFKGKSEPGTVTWYIMSLNEMWIQMDWTVQGFKTSSVVVPLTN